MKKKDQKLLLLRMKMQLRKEEEWHFMENESDLINLIIYFNIIFTNSLNESNVVFRAH